MYVQANVGVTERQQLSDIASLLCATLQSLLRKISQKDTEIISDEVMRVLLLMFGQGRGGVQEDIVMTIGVLVDGECVEVVVVSMIIMCFLSSPRRWLFEVHGSLQRLLATGFTKCRGNRGEKCVYCYQL